MKIIAHVPAREGSKRLKTKNLLPIQGKPLIAHVIEAGKKSKLITELYVNTESQKIGDVGMKYGAKFYQRSGELAQDDITQDTFNYDFIKNTNPDVLVLLNPVCPLIETSDIDAAISLFLEKRPDCLVSTNAVQIYGLLNKSPLNFNSQEILPRTQDISPIEFLNFAIAIWDAKAFIKKFESDGHACVFGEVIYYDLPKNKAIKISDELDFQMAEFFLSRRNTTSY